MKDLHGEWMQLLDISGPFLTNPVLERVFPQGLEPIDSELVEDVQLAREEWRESQDEKNVESSAIHSEWIEFILRAVLGYDDEVLSSGDAIPNETSAEIPEHHVQVVPDYIVVNPEGANAAGTPRLLVKVWPLAQELDETVEGSNWAAPPAERMALHCRAVGVRLGLVTNGHRWMLVDTAEGRVTAYVSWYSHLWIEERLTLRSFHALLGAKRLFGVAASDTLEALLDESIAFQEELTDQLGYQVRKAVEVVIQALDRADLDRNRKLLEGVTPGELYEAALTVMMRLVFLFCAEERGLLLLGDPVYDQYYAISPLRSQLREEADHVGVEVLERRQDAWARFLSTVRAVYGGIEHDTLRMPALGGSLFDPDRFPFLEGRAKGTTWIDTPASPLPIDNRTVLHLLESLQLLQMKGREGKTEARKLSFRALDVEQIGYVYEGLLDHVAVRVGEITLGLAGTKDKEPEIKLSELEAEKVKGQRHLLSLLKEKTGRSEAALKNALTQAADESTQERLIVACGNNREILARVIPYYELLRADVWGYPQIYLPGSFMVTGGPERRETGTHYTPKFLTEKIVAETLEPVVYMGPAEGKPRDQWVLRKASELLDLKVCDMAMGSGAFLVQACQWLSERLLEAWNEAEREGRLVTSDGEVVDKAAGSELMPGRPEDRRDFAKRLIAERCLYGVDINSMAVELAKLSLWLVTLAKNRPFGFLDHNLRSGDSLLGIRDIAQLLYFHPDLERGKALHRTPLFDRTKRIGEAIREAVQRRDEIGKARVLDIEDVRQKAKLEEQVKKILSKLKVASDFVIGCAISMAGERDAALDRQLAASIDKIAHLLSKQDENGELSESIRAEAQKCLDGGCPERLKPRRPLHWAIEFPEVFGRSNGGFDAIMGNPPFKGGQKITGSLGTDYRNYLVQWLARGKKGSADLVAYFFLHAYELIRNSGNFGLLAVNTIAEGDTRQVGLEQMAKNGAVIYAAYPNEPWPGKAAVVTSRVHVHKGGWKGNRSLLGRGVAYISPFLSDREEWTPKRLKANEGISFQGSIVLGMGFVISEEVALEMIDRDPRNRDVLFPYLNGEDLNSHPEQKPSRWVINFWDWPEEKAALYPEPFRIIKEKVKPQRDALDDRTSVSRRRKQYWWLYASDAKSLYHAIGRGHHFEQHPQGWSEDGQPSNQILMISRVSKTGAFVFIPNKYIASDATNVFAIDGFSIFSVLQSNFHIPYAWEHSSKLKGDLRYSPSDCFETFPLPDLLEYRKEIEDAGKKYHALRSEIMKSKRIGLTALYTLYHDHNIREEKVDEMRQLKIDMDKLIAKTYEWADIEYKHGFYEVPYLPDNDNVRFTVCEIARRELLNRFSELNRMRYEQEVRAGLHEAAVRKSGTRTPKPSRSREVVVEFEREETTPSVSRAAQTYLQYEEIPTELPLAAEKLKPFADPEDVILDWLEAHPGWNDRAVLLGGTGLEEKEFEKGMEYLLNGNFIQTKTENGREYFKSK